MKPLLPNISPRWLRRENAGGLVGILVRLGILSLAVGIAVLFMVRWDSWVGMRVDQTTDDAYVKGDLTPLSAKVDGYVRQVPVNDYERVKAGDLLVEIEDDDYKARVAQAEADVTASRSQSK